MHASVNLIQRHDTSIFSPTKNQVGGLKGQSSDPLALEHLSPLYQLEGREVVSEELAVCKAEKDVAVVEGSPGYCAYFTVGV